MVYRAQVYNLTVRLLPFNLRSHLYIAMPSQPCAIRQRFDLFSSNQLFHIASNRPCHPKEEGENVRLETKTLSFLNEHL
jgi:hypothetical protein